MPRRHAALVQTFQGLPPEKKYVAMFGVPHFPPETWNVRNGCFCWGLHQIKFAEAAFSSWMFVVFSALARLSPLPPCAEGAKARGSVGADGVWTIRWGRAGWKAFRIA